MNIAATRQRLEQLLIERARTDRTFRRELLANPYGAIAALGHTLPAQMEVTVVEETADHLHLVLPSMTPSGVELEDDDLAAVAGGADGALTIKEKQQRIKELQAELDKLT